ncbi:MAG: late promoter transcription accessory protein [Candidatus Pacebacteria bacterium]|jgi:hypothetical protein|nr:late promoter transcription accessory protein [Candidatus Paceibacterota bacterium]|tara:strand:- start:112 stop:333 length:222 start_codon:yes stop_codon:yes gene_type:complete
MVGEKITTKKFSLLIEEIVKTKRVSYLEAVIMYCAEKGIEPQTVTKWVDNGLKEKIQYEAESLNYLPKTSSLF